MNAIAGAVAATDAALNAGLLTRIRLDGGSESASPNHRGHFKDEIAVTALLGRATTCLRTGTRDPGRLGSAIAPHTIVFNVVPSVEGPLHNRVHGTSASGAVDALAMMEKL